MITFIILVKQLICIYVEMGKCSKRPNPIAHHIFRFMSQPTAEAVRSRVEACPECCNLNESDDCRTCCIWGKKMRDLAQALEKLCDECGVHARVDGSHFKPSLRRMYEWP